MTDTSMQKVDGGSEGSLCLDKDKGIEKPSRKDVALERKLGESRRKTEENILQINRQKQRMLLEANIEKDKRLEELEKEINDHNTQHREGIYWLRLQLDTTRREKSASDERIAELHKELRRLSSDRPSRNTSLDPTITETSGNEDEKDNLIAELQNRVQMYESSFGVMENQMTMMRTSSGEVIKTLKEEIADLMEDRTRAELDLLNQLSELDNENRRRQLEHTLELHNKDETIEILRNLETCSISANGQQASSLTTMIYDGSSSTDDTKNSIFGCEIWSSDQPNDVSTGLTRAGKDQSSLVLRLGEENAELQRKLDKANKELQELRSESDPKDNLQSVERVSEERRAINLSMDRLKAVLGSTNNAVSKLKEIVEKLKAHDDSGTEKGKKRILSVLESASLVHEEVRLSVLLTELKLRNEFECLKKNRLMNGAENQAALDKQQLINDLEMIQNDALVELEKAEEGFSTRIKDLERRVKSEKSKLGEMIKKDSQKRAKKHGSKASKSSKVDSEDGLQRLQKLLSSSRAARDLEDGSKTTGDRIMISRSVLNLLERELLQFAERIKSKNKKIGLLKGELEKCKARENHLRKELRDSSKVSADRNRNRTKTKKDSSNKSYELVNDAGEANEDNGKDSLLSKSIPREILTGTEDQPTVSPVVSPLPSNHRRISLKLKGEIIRRRLGRSDDSQEGGTDPAIAPAHRLTPGNRVQSIGFVPSPSRTGKKGISNSTSPTKPTSDDNRRLQPDSREIKKLVFLPPCFFQDLEQLR